MSAADSTDATSSSAETASPEVVDVPTVPTTFATVMMAKLASAEFLASLRFDMGPEMLKVVQEVLAKNAQPVEDIKNKLIAIVRDGTINFKDVPAFLAMIEPLYIIVKNIHARRSQEVCKVVNVLIKLALQYAISEKSFAGQVREAKRVAFANDVYAFIDAVTENMQSPKRARHPNPVVASVGGVLSMLVSVPMAGLSALSSAIHHATAPSAPATA